MALIDADGYPIGKLGDKVYCRLGSKHYIRDMPKDFRDAKTPSQKFIRDIFRGDVDERITCIIANAGLTGQKPADFFWRRNYAVGLTASKMIAASCGWDELMLLLIEGPHPYPFTQIKPEIVWTGFRGDKLCLLAFIPSPHQHGLTTVKTVRLALRAWMSLYYHSSNMHDKLVAVAEAPINPQGMSLDIIPEFYKPKAETFLAKHYKNYKAEYRAKALKWTQFAAMELDGFPVPEHKFLRPRIKFTDISGGSAHIWIDIAGMMEKKYGDGAFYCALKSKVSDKVVLKSPERELDDFGKELAAHLSNLHRERTAKRLADPKKRDEYNSYYRQRWQVWKKKKPEQMQAKQMRATEQRRIRYNTDPKYRARTLELNRKRRENRHRD